MTRRRIAPSRTRRSISDRFGFSAIALIVVFGSLFGIVVVQTFIVQNRVQLDSINADLFEQEERNRELRLDVIELESPERILDTAVSRLGMVRPTDRNYLPGVDPDVDILDAPGFGDPFGPAPLPQDLLDAFLETGTTGNTGKTVSPTPETNDGAEVGQ